MCVCPYNARGASNCMAIHKSKPDHLLLFCPLYKCMYVHIIRIYIKNYSVVIILFDNCVEHWISVLRMSTSGIFQKRIGFLID